MLTGKGKGNTLLVIVVLILILNLNIGLVMNLLLTAFPVVALCAGAAVVPARSERSVRVEREAFVMGTTLHAGVAAEDRASGIAAIGRAFEAVHRADSLLSTWRDDSEIARVNRAPVGRPVSVSVELYALLREADRWSRATAGAFDPAVGSLVDAWDLRGAGRMPADHELAQARAAAGLDRFAFNDSARTLTRTAAGAWIDTGGFGKGAALRDAARELRASGVTSALLNFGGQVLVLGEDDGRPWQVPVAHPSRRREPAAVLRLPGGRSAATSSQSERANHILDPRTGRPVPAWGSVTVVAADPAVADILSTALFVLGPEAGLAWLGDRDDVGALFLVERQGRVQPRWNRAMAAYLATEAPHNPHRGG